VQGARFKFRVEQKPIPKIWIRYWRREPQRNCTRLLVKKSLKCLEATTAIFKLTAAFFDRRYNGKWVCKFSILPFNSPQRWKKF